MGKGLTILTLALSLTGCVSAMAERRVVSTASFDHDCPPEKIHVVSKADGVFAYAVDVCGSRRKYRDFGNEKEFQFVDVTDGTPAPSRDR